MAKRLVNILATASDLRRFAADLSGLMSLKYVYANPQDNFSDRAVYQSIGDIPGLGVAQSGQTAGNTQFAAVASNAKLYHRKLDVNVQRVVWYLDYERMRNVVEFNLPGVHKRARALIAGEFAAVSDAPGAVAILKAMRDALKMTFVRRGNGLVGPEAWELAQKGYRCTHDTRSASEYDIALS